MTKKVRDAIINNIGKIAIVILGILLGAWVYNAFTVASSKAVVATTHPVRETVQETVAVSGQVESAQSSSLSFEKSGVIARVNVKVGDRVAAGQTLASISGGDDYANIQQAQAAVDQVQATLNSVLEGATPAEISLRKQALENAELDLANAENMIQDTTRTIQNTLYDIINNKLAPLFTVNSGGYTVAFTSCSQSLSSAVANERSMYNVISVSDLDKGYELAQKVNTFLTSVNDLLALPCVISDSEFNDERAIVSGAQASLAGLFATIANTKSGLLAANNAVARATRDLELIQEPADKNRIAVQQAAVAQAQARLSQAKATAGKNVLSAPFAGLVSAVHVAAGEMGTMGVPAFTLISDSAFQIKAKIAEVDIVKIAVGNKAQVTLDAYGDTPFVATVTRVDPAATIENGVARYGIVLTFTEKDDHIKSGMTANAQIATELHENALVLPASYVEMKSGKGAVKKVTVDGVVDVEVTVGVRTTDGKVQIVSGLSEADEVQEIAKK